MPLWFKVLICAFTFGLAQFCDQALFGFNGNYAHDYYAATH